MANRQELKVTERDTTLTPRKLRDAGFLTANIYGNNVETVLVQTKAHEFFHALSRGGSEFKLTGFVDAVVRVQQMQRDAVSNVPFNVEFFLLEGKLPKSEKPANKATDAKKAGKAKQAEPALAK